MHKSLIFGSIATLGLAGQALAQDGFSYSYVEAAWVQTDFDDELFDGEIDGDGIGLRGSVAFSDMIHGYVDYRTQDFDIVDIDTWEVGVGFNHSLSPQLDLIARLGYTKFDADVFDDDGFAVQAGVRGRPMERVELEGLLHYVNLDEVGDGTAAVVNGRYFFTEMFSAGAGAEFDDDETTWNIAVRYTFNTK